MATERLLMRHIREILRLKWTLRRSHRETARSLGISAGAVASVVTRAHATGLTWDRVGALSDDALERTLYGPKLALTVARPGQLRDLSKRDLAILSEGAVDLGPIVGYTRADLVRSVVAYLRHRGHWEDAARDLDIHHNTLRHRIGTASRVMGADLNDPDVASRLWLALRAAGLA